MARQLKDLRPVYAVGIGFHKYQFASETSYITLGLTAIREALTDANIAWECVESAYIAKALLPMAIGRNLLKYLGASGIPLQHVENASASGSTAFRNACIEVGAGLSDLTLAMGVDKPMLTPSAPASTGVPNLANRSIAPFTHFALLADSYFQQSPFTVEDMAEVAVKNHRNASMNPYAQHQKVRTFDEILGGKKISGSFTSLQCTPIGEGAAAVLVASEAGIKKLGIDASRAIRVTASAAHSERIYKETDRFDAALTQETTADALQQAGLSPNELDIIELHDAFAIEELEYLEAMQLCPDGKAMHFLKEGAFNIGGTCAVNPSGGLIGMGHPIGPTGIGQIAEIVRQLRGEAGKRQQKNARKGLAHMVGVGAVCYVHILEK